MISSFEVFYVLSYKMSSLNLDTGFSSSNGSNEKENLQKEKQMNAMENDYPIDKEKEQNLIQFFDGEDEDADEENDDKGETNESAIDKNDMWENSKEPKDTRKKTEGRDVEEMSDSSVEQLFEGEEETKDVSATKKQEKEETKEIFERGESESESENEIVNRKKFKKNKMKKRILEENNESKKSYEENDRKIKKKRKKLTKCNFIDNAAEVGEEDEEEAEQMRRGEEENFMLEGEEYKKSTTDQNNNHQAHLKKKKTNKSQELDFNGFDSFTEEEYEAEKESVTKSKSKKTSFDEITDTLKLNRKKTVKISEEDALQYCESVLNQMVLLHEQDIKFRKEHKPMTAKLQVIDEVCKILTKPKWKPYFMRLDIYHALSLWLMPLHKNTLPHYSIRTNLLKVIQQLPITFKGLMGTQLGKVLTYLYTHKDETDDNKKIIRSVVENWMSPFMGINTNYKHSIKQRQKKIRENPEFHKKILEKAKTLIPDSICIEKEEEQNELKRHATIPYNSECSFLINVPSYIPENANQNMPKSKIKRLADNLKMNKRCRKSHKVSIEGKGVAVAP